MSTFALTILCACLCALNIYLGFVRPPRIFRRYVQSGAIVFFLLTLLSGYFAWRETGAVDELAQLIEPVPEITGVLYVPAPGEVQTIAKALAATPGTTRAGTTQAERRQLAEETENLSARYWRLDTALAPEEVIAFYRDQPNRGRWQFAADSAPLLTLERGPETLIIYTDRDRLRPVTEVWYIYEPGSD